MGLRTILKNYLFIFPIAVLEVMAVNNFIK